MSGALPAGATAIASVPGAARPAPRPGLATWAERWLGPRSLPADAAAAIARDLAAAQWRIVPTELRALARLAALLAGVAALGGLGAALGLG
ncbi:MAG: hypothetical protein QXG65_06635, partial [Thermoplasmata archaeon]